MRPRLSGLLFLATVLTTTIAGSWMEGVDLFTEPLWFLRGLPFSCSLLAILGAHELAHFFTARRHGVKATWPMFIPSPVLFVGTFGAVIRIKSVIPDRRALLEIGASGPLAGFLVSLPLAVAGVAMSTVKVIDIPAGSGFSLGSSLLFFILEKTFFSPLPEGGVIILHPMAYAAWFGFLVTAMNLLPIGQLDGGHIIYALFRRRRKALTILFLLALVPLGFIWPGWMFWGGLMCLIGFRHPPVLNENLSLAPRQKLLAALALITLILTFIPAPFII